MSKIHKKTQEILTRIRESDIKKPYFWETLLDFEIFQYIQNGYYYNLFVDFFKRFAHIWYNNKDFWYVCGVLLEETYDEDTRDFNDASDLMEVWDFFDTYSEDKLYNLVECYLEHLEKNEYYKANIM